MQPSELARATTSLSADYRGAGSPVKLTRNQAVAYAVTRMPATFAALSAVLRELPIRPRSVLDLGSGTGAAAWAVGTVDRVTLVERDREMLRVAQELEPPGMPRWREHDVTQVLAWDPHDLVIVSYLLGELGEGEGARLVRSAWEAATQFVLIIEPGTPAGYARVLGARSQLLELGASIAAPCPHGGECPLVSLSGDWCHFSERLERTRAHRFAKKADLGYEDEKFSYVLAGRPGLKPDEERPFRRVLRHPRFEKGLVKLRLCAPSGIAEQTISKGDQEHYRRARKVHWGDRF